MTLHDMTQEREAIGLPATPAACRAQMARLQDEITSIKTQIATADIRRQTEKKPLDPVGFHRARTALRMKQQELVRVKTHMLSLKPAEGHFPSSVSGRQSLQATLLQVCRAACSEEQWDALVHQAKQLQAEQEGAHG